ncbi:MAG: NADPH-dependent assimilatory sulfite reductase hemoprotein subunit [Pirellulales bacterium]|nr:NADPH-dependent assimilatory sulfite reductase hemoprotein subunit [Pirellulales bacterium]
MSDEEPSGSALSPVEKTKQASNYLRGTIREELQGETSAFNKDNATLLKFHGTYQQDDRDVRSEKTAAAGKKREKEYSFMVRVRIPGGQLTADQFLAQLDVGDQLGNANIRLTTRQAIQFHGVVKQNLWPVIHRINEIELSTLAACGDVVRNIMCCPAPINGDPVHGQMKAMCDRLVQHLAPRTPAYHEIWVAEPGAEPQLVNGAAAHGAAGEEIEPIYGRTYLPRKFKIAVGLPGDNCVDIYSQDLGFMAICEDYNVVGYNVLVGGGFGMTPSAKKTFPAIAKRLTYVRPDQVLDVAEAIIKVQRDHGNRSDRKVARLKYLIHNWGLERFKEAVEQAFGQKLPEPHPDDVRGFDDHLGWHEQGDGRWFYGLNVENGRVKDEGNFRLKTALRVLLQELQPGVRLTTHQSLLFTDLAEDQRSGLEQILREHGVKLSHEISQVRRWSMACVAWPTCSLAITESERALPGVIDRLETEVARLGLSSEAFTVRMTGCPNGCARPFNSDVGLVGKAVGKYTVYLGGRLLGNRLNTLYKDLVPLEEIVPTLVPALAFFKQQRINGETFGDFCDRQGVEAIRAFAEQFAAVQAG